VNEHRPEVADVFRQHGQEFLVRWGHTLNWQQIKALRDIGACQTWKLGAHVRQCDSCEQQVTAFNSCRNRHCPRCQSTARDRWLERTARELLPVPYSHMVFTLPKQLSRVALQNPALIYGLLFKAVSETLLIMAADPTRLGARIGFLAVLHTWNQQVMHHPHLHCLVPAGGISPDRSRWIASRPKYFLNVDALGAMFRGKFLAFLRQAYAKGRLRLGGPLKPLTVRTTFDRFTLDLKDLKWVVYAKPPFAGPAHAVKYLARYTHRVAIANGRILSFAEGRVTFRWRDSAHGNKQKIMTLDAVEFLRRFLLHVLPCGFVKIRHYGFLANGVRASSLKLCRSLMPPVAAPAASLPPEQHRANRGTCPACGSGRMVVVGIITATQLLALRAVPEADTS
jgi:Putative transposase/Transposase zinc-binding domain